MNNAAAPAAMAATATIPIVFASGADPVKSGLVVSLNRPSSNVTGVYFLIDALPTKNLHLLHELVPQTSTVALLVNPNNAVAVGTELPSVQAAARTLGLNLVVVKEPRSGTSMRHSQTSSMRALGHSSSQVIHSFLATDNRSLHWRHATRPLQPIHGAKLPRPAA